MQVENRRYSTIVYLLFCVCILILNLFYYPKWKKEVTEATISWDVSGYYWYLPAILIYEDPADQKFHKEILDKYQPTYNFQQAFLSRNGKYVMKYSMGQAIQYLPAFAIGHSIASLTDYEADGFSPPYQVSLSMYSLLMAMLGMWILMHLLLRYFDDGTAAFTLFIIGLATNYLNYSAIDNAMTHNYLFTLYALLILQTIRFYKDQTYRKATSIGLIIGVMMLTRPTEIVAVFIPLLWGIGTWSGVKERISFIFRNKRYLSIAVICTALVGSLQLLYWKWVGEEWIIYSYQDQGFSWLSPYILEASLSYKSGWLTYTPAMILSIIGIPFLWSMYPQLRFAVLSVFASAIYITFAWDIWWYGESLGQRAMIQYYVVIAFVIASFIAKLKFGGRLILSLFVIICTYYNFWLTIQAHTGRLFVSEHMNKAFFWRVVGRWEVPEEVFKLLDTDYIWEGERKNVKLVFEDDFENTEDSSSLTRDTEVVIAGDYSVVVPTQGGFSPEWVVPYAQLQTGQQHVRVGATFLAPTVEGVVWAQAQLVVQFRKGKEVVKHNAIRVHRILSKGIDKKIHIDVPLPKQPYDRLVAYVCNYSSNKKIYMDDIWIELFDEKY
ncbi:MAG: glycosyltransferase family 39 protein [Saprospiraceae bacterium]|nr:glycosyltransferase family 39 protein [Saprospiraceae bacterium]